MPEQEEPLNDLILKELQDIKRLLILALIQGGHSQEKIAAALDVNQSTISRLLSPPKKKTGRSS
jgi:DNA-binding transcriptional ArsR family regulator